jgi:hypothetical protein
MLYEVYSLRPFLELADIDNSSQHHLNILGFASKTLQINHDPANQSIKTLGIDQDSADRVIHYSVYLEPERTFTKCYSRFTYYNYLESIGNRPALLIAVQLGALILDICRPTPTNALALDNPIQISHV